MAKKKKVKKQDDMLPPIPKKKRNPQDLTLRNRRAIDKQLENEKQMMRSHLESIKFTISVLMDRIDKLEGKK